MNIWESSREIIYLALAVEVAVFIAHLIRPDKVRWYAFLAGPILALLGIIADMSRETYREAVERVTNEVVLAAEEEDAAAILDRLSDQFAHKNKLDKLAAEASIRLSFSRPIIDYNKITRYDLTDDDPARPVVEFTVITQFDRNASYGGIAKTRWRLEFVQDADEAYRIAGIEWLLLNDQKPPVDPFDNPTRFLK